MGEHFGKKMKAKLSKIQKKKKKFPALAFTKCHTLSFATTLSVGEFSPSLDGYVLPTRPLYAILKANK